MNLGFLLCLYRKSFPKITKPLLRKLFSALKNLLYLGFLLISFAGFTQFFPARIYTIDDGMPSYTVFDIAQTNDGVMWFASNRGIFSYNSMEWKLEPDSLNLPNSAYTRLITTSDGTLWTAGHNNTSFVLARYRDKEWKKISTGVNISLSTGFLIAARKENGGNELAIVVRRKVIEYSEESEKWQEILPSQDSTWKFNSIYYRDQTVFLTTNKGIFQVENGQLIPLKVNKLLGQDTNVLSVNRSGSKMYMLGVGWIAVYDGNKLRYLTRDNGIEKPSVFSKHNLVVDSVGRVFYSSQTYPSFIDKDTVIHPLLVNKVDFFFLSNKIFLDREENLWIGDHRGLFKLNIFSFKHYNKGAGLKDNEVSAIAEYQGDIMLANPEYLNYLKNGEIKASYKLDELQKQRILDMAVSEDTLYLTANRGGLLKLHGKKIKKIPSSDFSGVTSVANFDDRLFLSTKGGIFSYKQGIFNKESSLRSIRNLLTLNEDSLAIATFTSGLFIYNRETREVVQVTSDNLQYNVIYHSIIWRNQLLVATLGGIGIVKGQKIQPFKVDPEIEDLSVYTFVIDTKDRLWIGTNVGVYIWDGEDLITLNQKKGLLGNDVNRNAFIEDQNGNIWIGTESGASMYDYTFLNRDREVFTFDFTQARSLKGVPLKKGGTTLPFSDNSVEFSFIGISFINESKTAYRYKLVGLEEEWTEDFKENTIRYSKLPAGDYTFKVQSSISGQDWSPVIQLQFTIRPPFYSTLWFNFIIVALVVGLVYLAIRIRYRYLVRQKETLKKLVYERTTEIQKQNEALIDQRKEIEHINKKLETTIRDLQNTQQQLVQSERMASIGMLSAGISHELNNPLNYIQNGVQVLEDELKNEEVDNENIPTVIDIIRSGVKKAAQIVLNLNHFGSKDVEQNENCNLHYILDNCCSVIVNNHSDKLTIRKAYTNEKLEIVGNTGKLHQVFLNLLTNAEQAIEEKGEIYIQTKKNSSEIVIEISDTGVGIPEEIMDKIYEPFFTTKAPGSGTGLGLSISFNIIKEHKGELNLTSNHGNGTTARVTFRR